MDVYDLSEDQVKYFYKVFQIATKKVVAELLPYFDRSEENVYPSDRVGFTVTFYKGIQTVNAYFGLERNGKASVGCQSWKGDILLSTDPIVFTPYDAKEDRTVDVKFVGDPKADSDAVAKAVIDVVTECVKKLHIS